jgi:YfiH family protein
VGPDGAPGAALALMSVLQQVGAAPDRLFAARQVHGDAVVRIEELTAAERAPECDGLVTTTPGAALLVRGADCPLIAFADPAARVAGVVHSGWRGTRARIARAAVEAACAAGAVRTRLVVAVFPGIGPCCYEVGDEVRAAFDDTFGAAAEGWFETRTDGGPHLDLRAAIVATLAEAGVPPPFVDVVPGCTACDGRFFSHRGSGGATERHGLCVALGTPATGPTASRDQRGCPGDTRN